MIYRAIALSAALLPSAVLAQNAFTLPSAGAPSTNNIPIAVGQCRYQQWFSAQEVVAAQGMPGQFSALALQAGSQSVNTTVEVEVTMGHGFSTLGGSFAFNYADTPVVVFPRQNVTLVGGVAQFPYSTNFIWNGADPVVVELKVFNNGQGGNNFAHNNASTTTAFAQTTRAYAIGNALASFATSVQTGWGLFMDFTTVPGSVLDYGAGCPGEGGFVPQAVITSGIARPGQLWAHELRQANSQRLSILAFGSDDQMFNGSPLPLDLTAFNAPGCFLLNNVEQTAFAISVGGGPGSGLASISIQIPPITPIVGTSWYSQWFVLDENSANGFVSGSQGIWSIIAP